MASQDSEEKGERISYVKTYILTWIKWKECWVVQLIIVSNIIMFIITMFVNNCPRNNNAAVAGECVAKFLGRFSFQPLKMNPLLGPAPLPMNKLGSLSWNEVVNENQWWRVIASMWLHGGVYHLFSNMFPLFFIGIYIEQQFGFLRIGVIYLLSGLGGSIMSLLFLQNGFSVGASGALFGLVGAMLSELLTNWTVYTTNKVCGLLILLVAIVGQLEFGFHHLRINNFSHIGGVLVGFLLGFVLLFRPQLAWKESSRQLPIQTVDDHTNTNTKTKSKYNVFQWVSLVISLLLLIVGFTVGIVILLRGENGNDYCSWCHYMSTT